MTFTKEQIDKALEWYVKHEDHVLKMVENGLDQNIYPPSEEDVNHPEHDDMLEWVGGEFDPEEFDVDSINKGLKYIK